MARRRTRQVLAVVAGLALTLAGCAGDPAAKMQRVADASSSPTDSPTIDPSAPVRDRVLPTDGIDPALLPFYTQKVSWSSCGRGFECANIRVPLDWANPAGDSMTIATKRYLTDGDSMGTVLVNPGGPGSSGIELVEYLPYMVGADLLENFDLLGFDPRGVGDSSPVTCQTDAERDAANAKTYTTDDAGLAELRADAAAFGQACLANTGPVLGFVDTQSAARDMDVIKHVVGDEKLNYLGYSYGTQLGATYAGLYPEHVGRMVLDGAIDLRLTDQEMSLQQAVGFENALRAFVTDCQGGADCPLAGNVDDGMAQIKTLLDQTAANPLPTDDPDRPLTQSLAFYGIAGNLYAEHQWDGLRDALALALTGNGKLLLANADRYNSRNDDGTYADNSGEAFRAINCLDSRGDTDRAVMDADAAEIIAAAPTVGEAFTYGALGCAEWPFPQAAQDFDLAAPGAAPILVVGTTNDPATPYVWAQGLTEQLDSGVLLTYEGEGHTAYGSSNDCIIDAVDGYFVDGTPPAEGTIC